jgi:Golgi apparatus protein 1
VQHLLLDLLQRYKDETTFDPKCKGIVVRRMIEQSHDYRFNPMLQKGCHVDISEFCSEVIAKEPQDKELEGKVIKCLKVRFFQISIIYNNLTWLCAVYLIR